MEALLQYIKRQLEGAYPVLHAPLGKTACVLHCLCVSVSISGKERQMWHLQMKVRRRKEGEERRKWRQKAERQSMEEDDGWSQRGWEKISQC